MTRPPVYLPARLPVYPRQRRRSVTLAGLLGEALIIAAGFFALGFGIVIVAAVVAGIPAA